jgi:hypothetical protein
VLAARTCTGSTFDDDRKQVESSLFLLTACRSALRYDMSGRAHRSVGARSRHGGRRRRRRLGVRGQPPVHGEALHLATWCGAAHRRRLRRRLQRVRARPGVAGAAVGALWCATTQPKPPIVLTPVHTLKQSNRCKWRTTTAACERPYISMQRAPHVLTTFPDHAPKQARKIAMDNG